VGEGYTMGNVDSAGKNFALINRGVFGIIKLYFIFEIINYFKNYYTYAKRRVTNAK
jgi:hypothetical protein